MRADTLYDLSTRLRISIDTDSIRGLPDQLIARVTEQPLMAGVDIDEATIDEAGDRHGDRTGAEGRRETRLG